MALMGTFLRAGLKHVHPRMSEERPHVSRRRRGCSSGKVRYPSEAEALGTLIAVRAQRVEEGDPRSPECRVYPCGTCAGWHLTSRGLHADDLAIPRERGDGEEWSVYAKRLERRIAAQRAHIVSLLAIGHGGGNRELRKRIPALLLALGRADERWQEEKQNRENLVAILRQRHPLCWLVWRLTLGRRA